MREHVLWRTLHCSLVLIGCCGFYIVTFREGIAAAVDELLELSTANTPQEVADKNVQTEEFGPPEAPLKVVVVVGEQGVGKSAIVRRLAGQDIHALPAADATKESCTECERASGLRLRIHELPTAGEVASAREMSLSCGTVGAGEVIGGFTTLAPPRLPQYLRLKPEDGGTKIDAVIWVCNSTLLEDGQGGQIDGRTLHTVLSGPDRDLFDGVPLLCVANKVDLQSPGSPSVIDGEVSIAKPLEETSIAAEKRLGLHMLPQRCWRLFRVSALSGEGLSSAFSWLERFVSEPLRETNVWFGGEIHRLTEDIATLQRQLKRSDEKCTRKADAASKKEKAAVAGRMADLKEQLESARTYYGKKVRTVDDQRRAEKAKASRLEARCQALEGALQEKERCNSDLRSTIEELQRALIASQCREDAASSVLHGCGVDEIDQAWRDVHQHSKCSDEQATRETGFVQATSAYAANKVKSHHNMQDDLDAIIPANSRRTRASRAEQGRRGRDREGCDPGTAKGLATAVNARTARDLELAAAFRQRHARTLGLSENHHQKPCPQLWNLGQVTLSEEVGIWNPGAGADGLGGYNAVLGPAAVAEAVWRAERGQRRSAAHVQEEQAGAATSWATSRECPQQWNTITSE